VRFEPHAPIELRSARPSIRFRPRA
jgi:hypothetical protein